MYIARNEGFHKSYLWLFLVNRPRGNNLKVQIIESAWLDHWKMPKDSSISLRVWLSRQLSMLLWNHCTMSYNLELSLYFHYCKLSNIRTRCPSTHRTVNLIANFEFGAGLSELFLFFIQFHFLISKKSLFFVFFCGV